MTPSACLSYCSFSYSTLVNVNDPNLPRVGRSRRFWEMDPDLLHTCSTRPCQPVTQHFFLPPFLVRQIFRFIYVGLKLKESHTPGKKIIKKIVQVDRDTQHVHNLSGSIFQKRREHLGFRAELTRAICVGAL